MFRIRKDRSFPTWAALIIGPMVGAGLAIGAAAKNQQQEAIVGFAIGGALAGLVAGAVLVVADLRRKKSTHDGAATAAPVPEHLKGTRYESNITRVGIRGFCFMITIIGVIVVVIEGRNTLQGVRSHHWQPTPARILRSKTHISPGLKKQEFRFWVTYRYRHEGQTHQSDRIQFGALNIDSQEELDDWTAKYPKNAEVTAYVDPESPSNSVLVPGVGFERYVGLLFGPLMIVGGLLGARTLSASRRP